MGVIPSISTKILGEDSGLCAKLVYRDGTVMGYQFSVENGKYKVEALIDDDERYFYPFKTPVQISEKTAATLPAVCVDDVFEEGYLHFMSGIKLLHIKTDKVEEFGCLLKNIHGTLFEGRFFEIWPMIHYSECTILDYSISLSMQVNELPGKTGYPTVEKLDKWFKEQGVDGVKIRKSSENRGGGAFRNTFSILFPLTTSFSKTDFQKRQLRLDKEHDLTRFPLNPNRGIPIAGSTEKMILRLEGTTRSGEFIEGPRPNCICEIPDVTVPKGIKKFGYGSDEIQKVKHYANFYTLDFLETSIRNCFAEYLILRPYPFCVNHSRPLIKEARELVSDIPLLNAICKTPIDFSAFDSVLSTGYKRYEAKVELGEIDENLPFSESEVNTELENALKEALLSHELMLAKFNYPVDKITSRLFAKNGKIWLSLIVATKRGASK